MNRARLVSVTVPLFAGLLAGGAGCSDRAVPDEAAGLAWVRVAEAHAALTAIVYEGTAESQTAEQAAGDAAASVEAKLGACAKATVTGATVSYAFTHCAGGPYGLTDLDGVLQASYLVVGSQGKAAQFVEVVLEGKGVSLGGAILDVKADVIGAQARAEQPSHPEPASVNALGVAATSTGTLKDGSRITVTGTEGAYADSDRCADSAVTPPSLEVATGSIESLGKPWLTRAEGFRRCGQSCPAAGGILGVTEDIDGLAGNNTPVFFRFDGSAQAKVFTFWSADGQGDSHPFDLGCMPL